MNKNNINEIIKMIDDVRFKISQIDEPSTEIDLISSDEGLEKFLKRLAGIPKSYVKIELLYEIEDLAILFNVTAKEVYNWNKQGLLNFAQSKYQTFVTSTQLTEFIKKSQHNLKFGR